MLHSAAIDSAAWALLAVLTWRQVLRWRRRSGGQGDGTADAEDAAAAGEGKASKAAGPPSFAINARASSEGSTGSSGGSSGGDTPRPQAGKPAAAAVDDAAAIDRAAHAIVDAAEEEAQRKVHVVGSSVNLPDMSANLAAKVAVSEAQQSDPRLLAAVYDDMAAKFAEHGLNLPAVAAMQQYFDNLEGEGEARPLEYSRFPVPLPPGSVRLGVIFFQEFNRQLADMVHQAAQEVVAALPPGCKFHVNRPSHYHLTIYMTSQPHTLRPNPFDPAAGGLPEGSAEEQAAAAKPDPDNLKREIEAFRVAAAGTDAPRFEVHRLLMADSGTLLLCSVDHSGHLAQLRKRLRHAFPGGPPKQSTIVHASIARVLTPSQLSKEHIAAVQEVCDRWTSRLRGQRFDPDRISFIQEHTFTTVEGPRVPLPFKRSI
ncbi:hypothetical protein C2E21_3465 isoform B [Chlorella sorokiniana]|uniref:Uncharacterized protein n=1 Tax=Chlorella sorokiniana TaxID=3076 RepID=A0A2P6TUD1_CHLSO|nr:hypothetical protein C2E21_3465 isoform B [Chlorella sorokiniana]|eukprot:PRW57675.1 hypothetical protein C2E21_3465 isoform B [Chlorella sorokiniana]